MKIKYKVVKRRTRMSAMINGNSKYAIKYLDGARSYADENTLGIFVFETLAAAESWANAWWSGYDDGKDLIILMVLPIGRGKRVTWIAEGIESDTLDDFYNDYENSLHVEAPDRTMAYPGVDVLGEYEYAS